MTKVLSTHNLYEKQYITYNFNGIFKEVLGEPSKGGMWILYGKEKNGKTWGALLLAKAFKEMGEKILYISGEEGFDKAFQDACKRAKVPPKAKNFNIAEEMPLEQIKALLYKRNAPTIVFIDNTSVYVDEFKRNDSLGLRNEFKKILFVFLSHEKRKEPEDRLGREVKKYAKIIIRAVGLQLQFSARCPGGLLNIDENKALLYHGINQKTT